MSKSGTSSLNRSVSVLSDLDDSHTIQPPCPMNANNVVQPLLTDLYQITMAYAYWKSGKQNDYAVFDLFFRKNPFKGEYTIFAGLEECLKFLSNFAFSKTDIDYIRTLLPETVEDEFYEYLSSLNAKQLRLYAVPEGSVVFPKVPLLRVEGPLPIAQMVETTLLTLVNYASLLATNASRHRLAAGPDTQLLEMGLRRAQGPDGGLSASKYAYIGGFDATSNVLAGKLYGIPVKGTHAHAFVMAYDSLANIQNKMLKHRQTEEIVNFVELSVKYQNEISKLLNVVMDEVSEGELASFIAYAIAFPANFFALIDTYDVLRSGVVNFCSVVLALASLDYRALGVRIDSGDLAYLSKKIHRIFEKVSIHYKMPWIEKLVIIASNDISEDTIYSLNDQGHNITAFGIGTQLVTCQRQPALGCVYKLVEVNQQPCIKLSLDVEKVTIPCRKEVYRLYSEDGSALLDLMQAKSEAPPQPNQRVLCRHPFQESKRAYVTPNKCESLLIEYFRHGRLLRELPSLTQVRQNCLNSLKTIRTDIKRYLNPTPYKVSISAELYSFMHDLWLKNAPIGELF